MASRTPISARRRVNRQRELRIGGAIGLVGLAAVAVLLWPKRPPPPLPPAPAPRIVNRPPAPPPPPTPAPEVLTPATLAAPDSLVVGSVLLVRWNGPDNPNDFVTLVEAEIPDATYGETRPTRSGRALEFLSPDRPGRWELRYVAGRAKKVLGRTVVTLRPLSAEIAAPGQAVMGTRLAVNWKGPNRPGDFLTIINRKTSDGVIGTTSLVDRGSPLELTVPVEPGEAEIRYMTKDGKVIGRHSLMITIPVTTLFAPDEVVAGATFEVRWHGPDNPSDAVALVPLGASGQAPRSTSTTLGSPLKLTAPSESGPAELRYLAGPKALVLSRRPIRVLPDR